MHHTPRLKTTASSKKPILVKVEDDCGIDDVTLQSIGAYMLFDEVDSESAKNLCEFIIKSNYIFPSDQVLTILVNSPGGEMYDGFSIIDLMETSRLNISTVGIGMIASMASLITTAGTKGLRVMTKNAFVMTHQFSTYFEGKYHELVATRDHDDELHERCIKHFKQYTTMTDKQIKDVFLGSSDKWLTAKEALKYGMCDRIQNPWS
jgi:ATP-dependent Clp protease protease subunit